jgi:UDP-4-amino-4,6-dideoxy-N-acetyl-beta-L-altrosamine transaminase
MIPYGHQEITQADIDAVIAVLRSDFLTQGPAVPRFEQLVAAYCGAPHAVAVNSATSALHLACLALGVGKGDVVWTSAVTFVASANCALYCGAEVEFVDIDPRTGNLSAEDLAKRLGQAEKRGRLPKVLIPVHLGGQSCDMHSIHQLAERYAFRIIEDASHAIGARYCDEPVGNCRYSDLTVFSFHPVKVITTGEGGMALTKDAKLARRMQLLRSHGVTRVAEEMTNASDGPWYYEQIDLGYNYRMTDVHAALGISQMARLDEFVTSRQRIAETYDRALASLPLMLPSREPNSRSSLHLYVVRVDRSRSRRSHREVFEAMRANGIGVNLHYIPIYRHPYYERMGFDRDGFPEAERYYAEAITLPIFPSLQPAQQNRVIEQLTAALA